ncbi:hypothetical protein [Halarchaeum nitratireducens]|uniref:hypothetical protein n=1 Tax=Halarchaeum nitratireducens TaxID=489913 RepID=UPI00166A245D|nr:hypothetical protein [Halarchaeum nitratireducens]
MYDGTETLDSSFSQTIGPGESAQFELNGFLSLYESSGGNVDLSLVANSSAGYAETSITRSVANANLDLLSISPTWQGSELQTVDFRVQNVGDVTGSFTATISVRGTEAGQASYQVDGGQTTTFTYGDGLASGYGPIYTVESGGDVPVEVTISSSSGSVSKTATKTFGDAEGSISDVDTTFIGRAGQDKSELSSVSFNVRNDGGIPLTYDSVEIELDGATRTDSATSTQPLATGSERTELTSFTDGIVVSDGSHDMTIRLTRDGETVASETTTVST